MLMRSDEIGQRIRELRQNRKLTQQNFASAAGVDASMLSKVEVGEVVPSLPWVEKVAEKLGLHLVFELMEPGESVGASTATGKGIWAAAVEAYLRTARGSSTPPWVAAKLMTVRHSHIEDEPDLVLAVHDTRLRLETADKAPDATQAHPKLNVPPRKRKR